jgi:hypothetical protein
MTHDHHVAAFDARENVLLGQFKAEIDKIKDEQVKDHEEAVKQFRVCFPIIPAHDRNVGVLMQVIREFAGSSQREGEPKATWNAVADDAPSDAPLQGDGEPVPRFRLTRELKDLFWQLIKLSDSKTQMVNEWRLG